MQLESTRRIVARRHASGQWRPHDRSVLARYGLGQGQRKQMAHSRPVATAIAGSDSVAARGIQTDFDEYPSSRCVIDTDGMSALVYTVVRPTDQLVNRA